MNRKTAEINYRIVLFACVLSVTFASGVWAQINGGESEFKKIFVNWSKLFNNKKYPEICELYSKDVKSSYQGVHNKDYSTICNGFNDLFNKPGGTFNSSFKIHDIYQSDKLAAVRITWYLDTYEYGTYLSSKQEEGLDIFRKESDGKWKIINYIAYPSEPCGENLSSKKH